MLSVHLSGEVATRQKGAGKRNSQKLLLQAWLKDPGFEEFYFSMGGAGEMQRQVLALGTRGDSVMLYVRAWTTHEFVASCGSQRCATLRHDPFGHIAAATVSGQRACAMCLENCMGSRVHQHLRVCQQGLDLVDLQGSHMHQSLTRCMLSSSRCANRGVRMCLR